MAAPDLATEASAAGAYPSTRFNQRERKLLESVKDYVDSVAGAGSITLSDLAPGIAPSHVVKFAGKHTTVGGAAAEAITVTGVLATDIVLVTVQSTADAAKVLLSAAPTTGTITLTFDVDPETDFVVSYSVLRAAS
jgi:hypothetical protein